MRSLTIQALWQVANSLFTWTIRAVFPMEGNKKTLEDLSLTLAEVINDITSSLHGRSVNLPHFVGTSSYGHLCYSKPLIDQPWWFCAMALISCCS